MGITIYFIATSLPDRLASVRDALLLKHPCEVTIKVLESALKDVERNLRSVASASGIGVAGGAVRVRAEAAEAAEVAWRVVVAGVQSSHSSRSTNSSSSGSSRLRGRGQDCVSRRVVPPTRRCFLCRVVTPSTADPSLFLRTNTLLPPFYILVYVDDLVFAAADTAGLAHVKALRTITLTQSHMVQQVLQRFDFTYSSPQATPLSTHHSLSALPSDESEKPSGPYPELVGCLMYLMTCTRPDLAYPLSILARYVAPGRHRPEHMAAAKRLLYYLCSTSGMGLVLGGRSPVVLTGHADASWVDNLATQRSSQGYTFSLGSGSVSWRSTRSSSVLSSSCEAEIYAGAMAAQELRWLTYLLTDLGEPPRSPPVLYADNNAMLALCREHRLEHRTKHIALRYFLARELHQRGQLRLAYVASQANTADIFTKALQPCDHQRFCTMLACFALLCLTGLLANRLCSPRAAPAASCPRATAGWRVWGWRVCELSPTPPPPPSSPTAAAAAEGGGCVGAEGVVLGG
ncbi:unnamed protein product [Closterium sp. NIES-53]